MSGPVAAPKRAPLELKLRIMLRMVVWSYPEFREILYYREVRECEDNRYASIYKRLYAYLRALELRQGLGLNRIEEVVRGEVGFRPPKRSISRWPIGTKHRSGACQCLTRDCRRWAFMGLILSDGRRVNIGTVAGLIHVSGRP